MTVTTEFWIVFNLVIAVMLFVDLNVVHKKAHAVTPKEAAFWVVFWIGLALCFNAGIHRFMGPEKAIQFFTGYVIEESLSVDNLFVFLMIFKYFSVPPQYQPRVLHWGILGAVVMRFLFIFGGVAILNRFHWVIYVFGGLLVFTAVKMAFEEERKIDPEKNWVLKAFRKVMPIALRDFVDERFFIRVNGVLHATPLFVVLLVMESSDIIFAMDSIPAIFAITTDPFIVYTSNVFAILGLRALFFLLSSIMPLFRYLKYGISLILAYVGVKMLVMGWFKIPTAVSLGVIVVVLTASVLLSLFIKDSSREGSPAA